MATAISLAEVPQPSDVESEVLYAIDARQKLQDAIEDQKGKGETAEIEFAKTFAKGIHLAQVVDPDGAVQKNGARKAAQERAQQRIEALESILLTVNKLIEQLKCDSPFAVNAALTRKIAALEKTFSEKEEAEKDLEKQIKLLKAEIIKLPKATAKKEC